MEETTQLLPDIYNRVQNMAQEWQQMQLLYDAALREINTKLEILNNEFKLTHQYNPIEHITSRIKSPESIAKKLRHKNLDLTIENIVNHINDVAGIRVICSFTSDIYRIAGLITGQSDVTVIKIKDYIEHPKENGYRSYHMIVALPIFLSETVVDTKVEIQIRTSAMDFWASLEHKMYYKFEGNAPANIRRELKECADLVTFLDQKMMAINEEMRRCADGAEGAQEADRERPWSEWEKIVPGGEATALQAAASGTGGALADGTEDALEQEYEMFRRERKLAFGGLFQEKKSGRKGALGWKKGEAL